MNLPARPMSMREVARRAVLDLAQAELTMAPADELRDSVAKALANLSVGSPMFHSYVARGLASVLELLDVAMNLTVLGECSCGLEINAHDWRHWKYVGLQRTDDPTEMYELRNCPVCRSTRAILIPPMKETTGGDHATANLDEAHPD